MKQNSVMSNSLLKASIMTEIYFQCKNSINVKAGEYTVKTRKALSEKEKWYLWTHIVLDSKYQLT